jgi:periplasmic divalent cation tolerance protein
MQKSLHIFFCRNDFKRKRFMNGFILVLTTVPDKKTGQEIASSLIEQKLAACVTLTAPAISLYTWKGKLCQEQEFLLFIKTHSKHYSALEKCILEAHPYEVPEIIALPLAAGHTKYLDWISEEIK